MHMCAYIPGQTKKEFKDTLPKVKTSLTLKFRLCASVCFLVFFFFCLFVSSENQCQHFWFLCQRVLLF